ncbi:hypothetical protein F2P79_019561 [Pimephales promelas]|nr:hypothetical protein F2P79_019561 [Pimephales promelas]
MGPQENDRHVAEALKDQKQLDLKISKTEIADSAIYYCALVPTWYRQNPGSRPEHLILITEYSDPDLSLRLSAKAAKDIKQVNLTISAAEETDSALYYCALKPTWYRQYPSTAPEFLLQAFENLGPQENDRHVAEALKDQKQLDLKISKTEIADSAIYYCALVPTWYRQNPGSRPEHLILITEYSDDPDLSLRLSAKAAKDIKQVNLTISSAEVSDSALYYCALKPTVT